MDAAKEPLTLRNGKRDNDGLGRDREQPIKEMPHRRTFHGGVTPDVSSMA